MPKLTQQQLETHLWGAANILRGRTAGQDYKTYILSLMFFKRLSDQWDHEATEKIADMERERGKPFTDVQRERLLASRDIHRFTLPVGCHWEDVRKVTASVGEVLTKAMRGIADANEELKGVFTVDWNQPAPDGKGTLVANEVVLALVNHFHAVNLSNANVQADILGRAYEYLIKQFADDAGAKAGEFFTPPEVVDILIRILEPKPGETVYDPTCGSGGMLVHSADFLQENGHGTAELRYFGQEMNWSTYAIARINTILHGLDAHIAGGKSTITDPQFLDGGQLRRFDIAIANFPFSDETWWLAAEQHTEQQIKEARKKFKGEYNDRYGRFVFGTPPASYGDYAFIQHIHASLNERGRAGVVCPQGVLFRGQPEVEEETGEFDAKGNTKVRRRKADAEHLIRKGLVDGRLIDAVIALPLNIFYGAGVPACLLILGKERPKPRRDKLLLVYAARHYRELSNKNQLRPQDVMRILVHYHAYGDVKKAAALIDRHAARLKAQIDVQAVDDSARVQAVFEELVQKGLPPKKRPKEEAARDERMAEVRKQAADERQAIDAVSEELRRLYANPAELAKHARVVDIAEVIENEYNLNIPRYVDTFEPEEPIDVAEALRELDVAEAVRKEAERELRRLLKSVGYGGSDPFT